MCVHWVHWLVSVSIHLVRLFSYRMARVFICVSCLGISFNVFHFCYFSFGFVSLAFLVSLILLFTQFAYMLLSSVVYRTRAHYRLRKTSTDDIVYAWHAHYWISFLCMCMFLCLQNVYVRSSSSSAALFWVMFPSLIWTASHWLHTEPLLVLFWVHVS